MNTISKGLIITALLSLVSIVCHAQGLERGNLVGVHIVTVTLKPNATMDDFIKFYVQQVVPEYEMFGCSRPWKTATGILMPTTRPTNWKKLRLKK